MPYQFTAEGQATAGRGQAVHGRPHLPERGRVPRAVRGARPRRRPADHGQAEGGGARARPVEPVPARTWRPTRPARSCPTSTTRRSPRSSARSAFASEALNCAAPDTGNMEILNLYGSENVKRDWLAPLLEGEIRSAFSMTEPDVASSDATNIGLRIERDGDEYVLNGKKWFSSGALRRALQGAHRDGQDRPRTRSRHLQQSMIAVAKDSPGHHHRPHAARVRLRPRRRPPRGRSTRTCACRPTTCSARRAAASPSPRPASGRAASTTACARSASAERALGVHGRAASLERTTFGTLGRPEGPHPGLDRRVPHRDRHGPRVRAAHRPPDGHRRQQGGGHGDLRASRWPSRAWRCEIIDRAIQVHGAAGVTQYTPLAEMYARMRTLRIADGPDEVHKMTIARREILRHDPNFRMNPPLGGGTGTRSRSPSPGRDDGDARP